MIVIPSINVETFEELQRRVKLVEPHVSWVHLDISDGTFTKNISWHNAEDLNSLKTDLNIEVHLMINNIDEKISEWLLPNVKRIFFHLDVCQDPNFIIEEIKQAGIEPGIAIGYDESWVNAGHFKGKVNPVRNDISNGVNIFQVLCVPAGPSGQKADEKNFIKIKEMKKFSQSFIIEADGGMNMETAKRAKEAGADIIVAASYIFNSNDIKRAIKELQ